MMPVTSVTSPPITLRKPLLIPPMNPIEWTLLPITRSPGLKPFNPRQYISLPEKPVITAMGISSCVPDDTLPTFPERDSHDPRGTGPAGQCVRRGVRTSHPRGGTHFRSPGSRGAAKLDRASQGPDHGGIAGGEHFR